VLVVAAALAVRGEDAEPPKPAPFVCTQPQLPPLPRDYTKRDLDDHRLRARLREIECELEFRRRAGGTESCYFGPEYARITNQRYEEIRQAHKSDPVELWHALLREPEDPNLPPIGSASHSRSRPTGARKTATARSGRAAWSEGAEPPLARAQALAVATAWPAVVGLARR
jgi:hypothetical protein